jgi:alpha-glucosidase
VRRHYIEERYKLLPYFYTVAEQTSHDGIPMMRPLFVEFPHATDDDHPIDLDADGSEFLVGPDLLVAPNPSPDAVDDYEVHLPPGTWYDYWSGERFERANRTASSDLEQMASAHPVKPLMIKPTLDLLPVYVRGGSILPISPPTQNTGEQPKGPLTLRIYPASDPAAPCTGQVYTDDGHTFAYREGAYARIRFSCAVSSDGSLAVTIAPQEGSFTPWWTAYRLEVHGFTPKTMHATDQSKTGANTGVIKRETSSTWSVLTAADPAGKTITLR